MEIELRKLEPADLADKVNLFQYESPGHFRVNVAEDSDGWTIRLEREEFRETFRKREYEVIVSPYKGNSEIHGAFLGDEMAGFIQFEFQDWNRSVRVWDIDVIPEFRGKGIGRAMMDLCKARSAELGARRIILETQSCNMKAIAFYRAMGFTLAGLDVSSYHNDDIDRKEVRLEMAFYFPE